MIDDIASSAVFLLALPNTSLVLGPQHITNSRQHITEVVFAQPLRWIQRLLVYQAPADSPSPVARARFRQPASPRAKQRLSQPLVLLVLNWSFSLPVARARASHLQNVGSVERLGSEAFLVPQLQQLPFRYTLRQPLDFVHVCRRQDLLAELWLLAEHCKRLSFLPVCTLSPHFLPDRRRQRLSTASRATDWGALPSISVAR